MTTDIRYFQSVRQVQTSVKGTHAHIERDLATWRDFNFGLYIGKRVLFAVFGHTLGAGKYMNHEKQLSL